MMWYNYLVPPLLGAVIGYLTNDLAIRMLFRPHQPKYIWGHRIPFTPGIIPKEKSRLAHSIGEMVSIHLMDKDTLSKNLLSDEMVEKVEASVDGFVEQLQTNPATLRASLPTMVTNVDQSVDDISEKLSKVIAQRLRNSRVSEDVSDKVVRYVIERTSKGALKLIGVGNVVELLSNRLQESISTHLDVILRENAEEMVRDMSKTEMNQLLDTPVSELMAGKDEWVGKGRAILLNLYRSAISEQLPKVLAAIDVQKMVEERINEMDVAEVEKITKEVLDKELKSIVWLGAVLGGLIGLFNLFVMLGK
ncbi:MAG: DUF445 family protein [Paludibacteraceae bacterium]|nr:DUF445 family protein [Paludibacteraceae bacterium]